jgi:endoglucanase
MSALRFVAERLDALSRAVCRVTRASKSARDEQRMFGARLPNGASNRPRRSVKGAARTAFYLLCLAPILASSPAAGEANQSITPRPLILDSRALPLGGALRGYAAVWQNYKDRFLTDRGRLRDTGSGMISHSEGQGYAMLLAVAANDRLTFDRLWNWTRANLMVRDDSLVAWRWQPDMRPAVSDLNNATDGDILIAWALTEAAEYWVDPAYRAAARRIAVEVGRKLVLTKTPIGMLLLPAVSGFSAEDRSDGPILNPSYWVFPAFERLPLVAPEVDWGGITESGLNLLKLAHFGRAGLPTDWISAHDGTVHPADGFAQQFGYDAIRIPFYLAWAGVGERDHFAGFVDWVNREASHPSVVNVADNSDVRPFGETGYAAIGALTMCAVEAKSIPNDIRTVRVDENYYPVTLHLLALVAAQMRYPSCLRG